ncbi:hypothetical protein [Methylobacterium nigriterrae]|uniref:hypothetical protein n=1 Tax=Methylobacterium nigriterrae TaxID=3127512 RepID=UPI0030137645
MGAARAVGSQSDQVTECGERDELAVAVEEPGIEAYLVDEAAEIRVEFDQNGVERLHDTEMNKPDRKSILIALKSSAVTASSRRPSECISTDGDMSHPLAF